MTLGEFMLGRWSDRRGRKPVLMLGLGLFISQFVGLALFQDFTWITLSFVLAGLGNAIYDPALSAYLLDIAPADHQARTMGIKSTIGSLGSVLGPALVVVFTPSLRPQHIFGAAAILVGLTILATYFFLKPNTGNDRI